MALLPYDHRLDRAGHLSVLARRFFDVWWIYEGEETRGVYIESMNRYPDFFRFDSHAHLVALISHLAVLYESRPDTINYGSLISEGESKDMLSSDAIDRARSILHSQDGVAKKVTILRSNVFAHRSASLSYEDAFRRAAICPDSIRDLANAGISISNILLADRGLDECFLATTTSTDTKRMLCALELDSCS